MNSNPEPASDEAGQRREAAGDLKAVYCACPAQPGTHQHDCGVCCHTPRGPMPLVGRRRDMTEDYTDIDKLRELAEAAKYARWVRDHHDIALRFHNDDQVRLMAACSPDVILALTAELVGLRTEVDQLRGETPKSKRDRYIEDLKREIATAQRGRDALQAEVERQKGIVYSQTKLNQEVIERALAAESEVAALQARIDAVAALHPPTEHGCKDEQETWVGIRNHIEGSVIVPTHYSVWECPTGAALGVDPQKEEQQ